MNAESSGFDGLKVLVVEDDALITMLLEASLLDLGCEVVGPAACVADAIKLISEVEIDVALLDLHLRFGEISYSVAAELTGRALPFVFVTGYDAASLHKDYRGSPTLQKPFGVEMLVDVLKTLVRAKAT